MKFPTPSSTAASKLLLFLGGAMAMGFALSASWLRGWNGLRDVGSFLGLFSVLFGFYFLAGWTSRHIPTGSRRVLFGILAAAALFRLLVLPAGLPPDDKFQAARADLASTEVGFQRYLLYDQDVWRYLWDGHVLANGLDPYRLTPNQWEEQAYEEDDPEAIMLFEEELWEDIFENVAYRDYLTVYPPLSQGFFSFLHVLRPGSVLMLKGALAALDLLACWLLVCLLRQLGGRQEDVLLYAWNPLVIKEIAGSGHVDGLVIPLLLGAALALVRRRDKLSMILLGMSVLAKLTPAVLVGLFARQRRIQYWPVLGLTIGLTVGFGYLPFWGSWQRMLQALSDFGADWTFNPGIWLLLQSLMEQVLPGRGGSVASAVWISSTLATLGWLWFRQPATDQAWVRNLYLLLIVFLLFAPTVMPWYLLWALPFAVACGSRGWPVVTFLALFSYLIYIDGNERVWWLAVEHTAIWLVLLWELWGWRGLSRGGREARALFSTGGAA